MPDELLDLSEVNCSGRAEQTTHAYQQAPVSQGHSFDLRNYAWSRSVALTKYLCICGPESALQRHIMANPFLWAYCSRPGPMANTSVNEGAHPMHLMRAVRAGL